MGAVITKSLLESEYDLIGYSSMKIHDENAKIKYGTYSLDLYEGPIYVEEIDYSGKNGAKITFTIGEWGCKIPEINIPIKEYIR